MCPPFDLESRDNNLCLCFLPYMHKNEGTNMEERDLQCYYCLLFLLDVLVSSKLQAYHIICGEKPAIEK